MNYFSFKSIQQFLENYSDKIGSLGFKILLVSTAYFYFYYGYLRSFMPVDFDQLTYIHSAFKNNITIFTDGEFPTLMITNTLDSLIMACLIDFIDYRYISIIINAAYFILFVYISLKYKSKLFTFIHIILIIIAFHTFVIATEFTSEFKTGLLLSLYLILLGESKERLDIKDLIIITFLLLAVRTINLIFIIGLYSIRLFFDFFLRKEFILKKFKAVLLGIIISSPFLIKTIMTQINYVISFSIEKVDVWSKIAGIQSKSDLIRYNFNTLFAYNPFFLTISLVALSLLLLSFFLKRKNNNYSKTLFYFIGFVGCFVIMSLPNTSNYKIIFWIYATWCLITSHVISLFCENNRLNSLAFILLSFFSIGILYSNFIKNRQDLVQLTEKYMPLDALNKHIVQLAERSSKKDVILFNNFVGVGPIVKYGLEINSKNKIEFNYINRLLQPSYDNTKINADLDSADILVIFENSNILPQWLPLNLQTKEIASAVRSAENFKLFKLDFRQNIKGNYVNIYKKIDFDLQVILNNPSIDNWMEKKTLIQLPKKINFAEEYDLEVTLTIPQDIFQMNQTDTLQLKINDNTGHLIESHKIYKTKENLQHRQILFTLDRLPQTINNIYLESNIWINYPNDPRQLTLFFEEAAIIPQ